MIVQNGKYKPNLSLEDKIDLSVELCKIALQCKGCSKLFKQAIENYSHQGGPSTDANRLTEGNNYNENTESRL